jgi:hypothetical protein
LVGTSANASDDTGYGDFYDTPPTGFLAMCAGNLPTADEVDPAQTDDDYPQKLFTSLTYTGGTTGHVTGFKPDWVWVKRRNSGQSHGLFDSNRGTTKVLNSDASNAEATSSGLTAFNTDGYNMGTYYNQSGNTYASWSWRANGGTTSTNATGSLSVTQQVDPSGSFSISTYSGDGGTDTIGHGLSSAPTMVIVKQRNGVNNWAVYAKGAGATKYAYLDSNAAFGTAAMWNNTTPSSSLVYLGDNNEVNAGSRTYVAYCFADTEGYCKSGSYVGNGNADGTYMYTGFRPAWFMIKDVSNINNWIVYDNAREPFNVMDKYLNPDTSGAEESGSLAEIDFVSNGIKMRTDHVAFNGSGRTYIYLAMAENPFKYATAR